MTSLGWSSAKRSKAKGGDNRPSPFSLAARRESILTYVLDGLVACQVVGQIVPANPASSVRGPKHIVRKGKTPVLEPVEARALLDSIDVTTPIRLRDRALIGLMVYSFARIGAALSMKVEDIYSERRRLWVRLREKGGKRHEMPCHHNLETYLTAYLEKTGIADDLKGPLFRTIGRGTHELTRTPLPTANAYMMIKRRAAAAGLETKIGNHSFRATGITAYLKNGGTLEKAASMANHPSTRTTQLYDRRADEVTLDDVDARRRLRLITNQVTPEDFALLRAVGEGYEYKEFAAIKKSAPGALRARVARLRRNLLALAS